MLKLKIKIVWGTWNRRVPYINPNTISKMKVNFSNKIFSFSLRIKPFFSLMEWEYSCQEQRVARIAKTFFLNVILKRGWGEKGLWKMMTRRFWTKWNRVGKKYRGLKKVDEDRVKFEDFAKRIQKMYYKLCCKFKPFRSFS